MQRHSRNFKNKNIKVRNNNTGLRSVSTFKEATSQMTSLSLPVFEFASIQTRLIVFNKTGSENRDT